MAGNGKPPVLVILQLTGGNDYFNTLIPYNDGNYYDMRPACRSPRTGFSSWMTLWACTPLWAL